MHYATHYIVHHAMHYSMHHAMHYAEEMLPEDEGETLREVGGLDALELLGRREAELHEVLGHRGVVLRVDVRDELDQRVLQVLRHRQRHPPVQDAELA